MKTIARLGTALAATLALAAPTTAQDSFRLSGDRVAVYNLAGDVEVVRGSGSEVVVRLQRGGADAGRLEVEVGRIQGRETLRVIYPGDEIVYDRGEGGRFSSEVRVRSDGTFGGGWGDRGDRVRVRSGGSGLEAWADLRIELPAGRDVQVWGVVGNMTARDVAASSLLLDTHSGRVTVDGLEGNLEVDTGSGSVDVRRIRGDVGIDTGSGRVSLDDVTGRSVLVDTGSGRVTATGVTADEVEVDTGSGSVELARIDARDLLVDTGSGSVEAELLGRVDRVEIDTGSGGVTLRLPPGLDAEIEADTGSGGIDVDFPVDVIRMSRDNFRGRAGAGRGSILVDTGSGRIRLIGG